jgi:hypothetical protein
MCSTLQQDGPITKNSSVPAPSTRRASNVKEAQIQKSDTNVSKIRPERWKATGIIALSDSSLKVTDSNFLTLLLN